MRGFGICIQGASGACSAQHAGSSLTMPVTAGFCNAQPFAQRVPLVLAILNIPQMVTRNTARCRLDLHSTRLAQHTTKLATQQHRQRLAHIRIHRGLWKSLMISTLDVCHTEHDGC